MKNLPLLASLLLNIVLVITFAFVLHKLGGLRYVYFKMKNRGVAGVYMHRKDIFKKLPKDSTDIVFLGNSLTEQGPWSEMFPDWDIKNRGIAGDMTEGVLDRLHTTLELKPKKLFLSIGVNDLLFHRPDYILSNYEKIVNKISSQSPSTQVFIQSLLPVNNKVRNTGVKNEDIQEINRGLKEISKSKKLIFIDLYNTFTDENGHLPEKFTLDGIHLNGEAYLLWKEALRQYIPTK